MAYNKVIFSDSELIRLYTKDHLTMDEIGEKCGVSRMAIKKHLDRLGVHSSMGELVITECNGCGRKLTVNRRRWKYNRSNYCNEACYYQELAKSGYNPSRKGRKEARELVSQYFILKPGHVVHHKDADETNNSINNLAVFSTNGDHVAYTRGDKTRMPIWDGAYDVINYSPFVCY